MFRELFMNCVLRRRLNCYAGNFSLFSVLLSCAMNMKTSAYVLLPSVLRRIKSERCRHVILGLRVGSDVDIIKRKTFFSLLTPPTRPSSSIIETANGAVECAVKAFEDHNINNPFTIVWQIILSVFCEPSKVQQHQS